MGAGLIENPESVFDNHVVSSSADEEFTEDISLRTMNEKYFHYGDNGYVVALYDEPVHYL